MKPYTVAFIFARGGSKGVPRKNIRSLAGKPLISYAIEVALSSSLIDRVVVSTEDPEIAGVAARYGAEVPFMRPLELAGDNSPEWLAWQHALNALNEDPNSRSPEVFVSVPATSPLRKVEDVDACIRTLLEGDADVVITVKPAERNPYFNMVVMDNKGYVDRVISDSSSISRRQDAPAVFDVATVAYVARPDFVLRANGIFEGKVKAVLVPSERAIDIDTPLDFEIAEFLMTRAL
jgi:N-acylneuraminate cytidylyltransferase